MYKSDYCEVRYNEELNIVFVKWQKFCCGNHYREPLMHALDIMKTYKGCNYVTDTTNGFENEHEDTQWLINEFIPGTIETCCKIIFFIISHDNNLKKEIEDQSIELRKHFRVVTCYNLNEVKQILNEK